MSRVGIIGSGDVGQKLGSGFAQAGHEVRLGTREPARDDLVEWARSSGPNASVGTLPETAGFGELLVLATRWDGAENALRLAGVERFEGKTLIDVTNPLVFRPNSVPGLALGHTDSAGEQVQRWLPKTRVVKAFNIVGNEDMFRPEFPGGPPDMFFCGNDASAKAQVREILTSFGWNPVDIGGIEGARLTEPLCLLWVEYAMRNGSRRHAFKMLRR